MAFFDTPTAETTQVKKSSQAKSFFTVPTEKERKFFDDNVENEKLRVQAEKDSSLRGIIENSFKGIKELFINAAPTNKKDLENLNPLTQAENPDSFLNVASRSQVETIKDARSRAVNAENVFDDEHSTRIDKAVALASAGIGGVNSVFTIITAPMAGLSTLPGVGNVVDTVNRAFGLIGQGGAKVTGEAVEMLPISKETKEKIRPVMEEIGALAGQALLGKGSADLYRNIAAKTKVVAKDIHDDALSRAPQPGQPETAPGGILSRNVVEEKPVTTPLVTEKSSVPTTEIRTPTPGALDIVEGTGPTRTRGVASSLEESAIANNLTKEFGELPQYRQVSMADQARLARDIVETDYNQAKRIAMGEELPPPGIFPESVMMAIRNRSIKNGDVGSILDLATKSKLTTEATTMGQRIRSLGEKSPEDPVSAIQEVRKAREKNATKSVKGGDMRIARAETIKEITRTIRKSAPTKQTWKEFINSIEC